MKRERHINIPITNASKKQKNINTPAPEAKKEPTTIPRTDEAGRKTAINIEESATPESKVAENLQLGSDRTSKDAKELDAVGAAPGKTAEELRLGTDRANKEAKELEAVRSAPGKTAEVIEQPQASPNKVEQGPEMPSSYLWKQIQEINIKTRTTKKIEKDIPDSEHQPKGIKQLQEVTTTSNKVENTIVVPSGLEKQGIPVTAVDGANKNEITLESAGPGDNKSEQVINVQDPGLTKNEQNIEDAAIGSGKALQNVEDAAIGSEKASQNIKDAGVDTKKQHLDIHDSTHEYKSQKDIVSYNWNPKDYIDIYTPQHEQKNEINIEEKEHVLKSDVEIPESVHQGKEQVDIAEGVHQEKEQVDIPENVHQTKEQIDIPENVHQSRNEAVVDMDSIVKDIKAALDDTLTRGRNIKDDAAFQKVIDIRQFVKDKLQELYGDVLTNEIYNNNAKDESKVISISLTNTAAAKYPSRPTSPLAGGSPKKLEDVITSEITAELVATSENRATQPGKIESKSIGISNNAKSQVLDPSIITFNDITSQAPGASVIPEANASSQVTISGPANVSTTPRTNSVLINKGELSLAKPPAQTIEYAFGDIAAQAAVLLPDTTTGGLTTISPPEAGPGAPSRSDSVLVNRTELSLAKQTVGYTFTDIATAPAAAISPGYTQYNTAGPDGGLRYSMEAEANIVKTAAPSIGDVSITGQLDTVTRERLFDQTKPNYVKPLTGVITSGNTTYGDHTLYTFPDITTAPPAAIYPGFTRYNNGADGELRYSMEAEANIVKTNAPSIPDVAITSQAVPFTRSVLFGATEANLVKPATGAMTITPNDDTGAGGTNAEYVGHPVIGDVSITGALDGSILSKEKVGAVNAAGNGPEIARSRLFVQTKPNYVKPSSGVLDPIQESNYPDHTTYGDVAITSQAVPFSRSVLFGATEANYVKPATGVMTITPHDDTGAGGTNAEYVGHKTYEFTRTTSVTDDEGVTSTVYSGPEPLAAHTDQTKSVDMAPDANVVRRAPSIGDASITGQLGTVTRERLFDQTKPNYLKPLTGALTTAETATYEGHTTYGDAAITSQQDAVTRTRLFDQTKPDYLKPLTGALTTAETATYEDHTTYAFARTTSVTDDTGVISTVYNGPGPLAAHADQTTSVDMGTDANVARRSPSIVLTDAGTLKTENINYDGVLNRDTGTLKTENINYDDVLNRDKWQRIEDIRKSYKRFANLSSELRDPLGMTSGAMAGSDMGFEKQMPLNLKLRMGLLDVGNISATIPSSFGGSGPGGAIGEQFRVPYYDLYFNANRGTRPLSPLGGVKQLVAGLAGSEGKPDEIAAKMPWNQGSGVINIGVVPKTSDEYLDKVKPVVITAGGSQLRGYGWIEIYHKGSDTDTISGSPMGIPGKEPEGPGIRGVYKGKIEKKKSPVSQIAPPGAMPGAGSSGMPEEGIPSRIPFQFTPEISGDGKSATWSAMQILGRSSSLYTYTGSQNRTLSIRLTFLAIDPPPAAPPTATELATKTIGDLAKGALKKDLLSSAAAWGGKALFGDTTYQGMEDMQGWNEPIIYWVVNTLRGLVVPQYRRLHTAPPVVRLVYGEYFLKRVSRKDNNGITTDEFIPPLFIVNNVTVDFEGQINPITKRHQKAIVSLAMTEVDEDIFSFEGFSELAGYWPTQPEAKAGDDKIKWGQAFAGAGRKLIGV